MSQINLTNGVIPDDPPAGQVAIFTKSSDKKLYYKDELGVVTGPLSAGGGGVTDLQTAYDGGNSIAIPLAGSPVAITNPSNASPALSVTHTFLGGGDAVQVTMSGSSTGTGVLSQTSGTGAAFVGVSLFTGDAFSADVQDSAAFTGKVAGSTAGARGLRLELTNPGASGIGIEVVNAGASSIGQLITMDPTSTAPGLVVTHPGSNPAIVTQTVNEKGFLALVSGNGDGVKVDLSSAASTGNGFLSQIQGGSATGVKVQMLPATAGVGLDIEQDGSGVALRIDPNTGDSIQVKTGANTLFSVDALGATSTPSVTFLVPGSPNTITVVGRSGVPGEPINPRVQLPGSVDVGALGRVWTEFYNPNASPLNLGTDPTTIAKLPTCFLIQNNIGPGLVLNLPLADAYHNGDEIRVANLSIPGNTIAVTSAGGTQSILSDFGTLATPGPFVIPAGAGLRFMARGGGSGGVGLVWILLTGVL